MAVEHQSMEEQQWEMLSTLTTQTTVMPVSQALPLTVTSPGVPQSRGVDSQDKQVQYNCGRGQGSYLLLASPEH